MQYDDSIFVYLDDIVIATPRFEKYIEVLREVCRHLKKKPISLSVLKNVMFVVLYLCAYSETVRTCYKQNRYHSAKNH